MSESSRNKTSTSERFVPPIEAAQELGDAVGDASEAEALLSGEAGLAKVEASESARELPSEDFEIPERAVIELGGRTVGAASGEDEEAKAPTNFETMRESVAEEISESIEKWYKYGGAPGLRLPRNLEHLSRFNYDLDGTIDTLAQIKLDMVAFGKTPEGKTTNGHNLGLTLHPLLVPWEFLSANTETASMLAKTLVGLRATQGIEEHIADYPFVPNFTDRYPDFRYFRGLSGSVLGGDSPTDHLKSKLENDGWWGVMLVQNNQIAGASTPKSPSELLKFSSGYRVDGYRADALGVFEWLALSLQEDPRTLAGRRTIMMANYGNMYVDGNNEKKMGPYGEWDEQRQRVSQGWAEEEDITPANYVIRLAIDPHTERVEKEEV